MKKILLLIITFLSVSFACDHPLKVYAAYDPTKVGEVAMVSAVTNQIMKAQPTAQIDNRPNAKFSDLDLTEQSVIVTVGQFGINLLQSQIIPAHVKVLLCTHQWFGAMNELRDIYITMPEHAINEIIQNIAIVNNLTLIPTQGVLHTMSKEALAAEDTSAISLHDAKVGVILGGDAETPEGGWKNFTADNARDLADQLVNFQKQTGLKILITNGPRTGRSPTAHRAGESDEISEGFLNALQQAGLRQGEDFEFFDFQFAQPGQPSLSALKAIVKTVLGNKGFMIVPGESTSSISEIRTVMPIAIYTNSAMNETHQEFVDQLVQSNLATLWPTAPEATESYILPPRQEIAVVEKFLS